MTRSLPTSPWSWSKRFAVACLIVLPLLTSCSQSEPSDTASVASEEPPATQTLTIEQQVWPPSTPAIRDGRCWAQGFGSPNVVSVKDDDGAVIASSAFSDSGELLIADDLLVCVWRVRLTVPANGSYTVEVSPTPEGWANPNLYDIFGDPTRCGEVLTGDCYSGYTRRLSSGELAGADWTIQLCGSFCLDLTNAVAGPLGTPTVEAPGGPCVQETDECRPIVVYIRLYDDAMRIQGDTCASNEAGSVNVLEVTSDQTGDEVLATEAFPDSGRMAGGACDLSFKLLLPVKDHVFYMFRVNPTPSGWKNPDAAGGSCGASGPSVCFSGWEADYNTEDFDFWTRNLSPEPGVPYIPLCETQPGQYDSSMSCL